MDPMAPESNKALERRLELHEQFVSILGTTENVESRVYFQPPPNVRMKYPAIVYQRGGGRTFRANNMAYAGKQQYQVTVIDADPDSDIYLKILSHFMLCDYDRSFTADNLNHDVLTIYY